MEVECPKCGGKIKVDLEKYAQILGFKREIKLSTDKQRTAQLKAKLSEYQKRLKPYTAPELQMDIICKIGVLEELLEKSKVDYTSLCQGMIEAYGSGFSPRAFLNAFNVIEDYNETGGTKVRHGTGLPSSR